MALLPDIEVELPVEWRFRSPRRANGSPVPGRCFVHELCVKK
jgi:hypothetical protein